MWGSAFEWEGMGGQTPVMKPMLPETNMLPNRDNVQASAVGTLAIAGVRLL